jgi:hypothetical protein
LPPTDRPIPCFAAEPPRESTPGGQWAERLAERFQEACALIETDEEIGDVGELEWYPDRTFGGRTYVPVTAPTSEGFEVFGFVSFAREHEGAEARDVAARADYTDDTADNNPDWTLDLSNQEIGPWRGPRGRSLDMTLVWGEALVPDGAMATAELGDTTTDQCALAEDRFTLVSLDSYQDDLLEVRLWAGGGEALAAESLYEEDDEDEEDAQA